MDVSALIFALLRLFNEKISHSFLEIRPRRGARENDGFVKVSWFDL